MAVSKQQRKVDITSEVNRASQKLTCRYYYSSASSCAASGNSLTERVCAICLAVAQGPEACYMKIASGKNGGLNSFQDFRHLRPCFVSRKLRPETRAEFGNRLARYEFRRRESGGPANQKVPDELTSITHILTLSQ